LDSSISNLANALKITKSQLVDVLQERHLIPDGDQAARVKPVRRPPLPKRARIRYENRNKDSKLKGTNIIEFLRAEYGRWLDGGVTRSSGAFTRPLLKRLDPSAYKALKNWVANGREIPPDLIIPSKKEANDRALKELLERSELKEGGAERTTSPPRPARLTEAARRRRIKVQNTQKHERT
jgi:hypothetical protein